MFFRWVNNRQIVTSDRGDFEIESDRIIRIQSHFVHTTGDFVAISSGTGASAAVLSGNIAEADKQGIGALRTGSTTTGTGRFGVNTGGSQAAVLLGFQDWIWESMSRILVLSNTVDRYVIVDGFFDVPTSPGVVDGVYFTYTDSINSGNWAAICVSNSVATSVDTGIPATLSWEKRKITINKAGTLARFFIGDTVRAEITTNIPTGSNRQTSPQFVITNLLGTGVNRGINVDYLECVGRR
jgi:hypothetical protein